MSLRSKIALVLFVAVSLFVGGSFVLTQLTFRQRVSEFDSQLARDKMGRVLDAFEAKLDQVGDATHELERQMGTPEDWTPDMELPLSIAKEPLHVVLAYDDQGWLFVHRILSRHTGEPTTLRELPNQKLSPGHPFVRWPEDWPEDQDRHGIWITELGALLVSMAVVEDSDPPLRLAVGRFLDEDLLAELREVSGVEFDAILAQGVMLPDHYQEVLALTARSTEPIVQADGDEMQTWATMPDLRDNAGLLLSAKAGDLAGLWSAMSRDSLVSALAVAIVFPFSILLLLQFIVTGPLSRLTTHVVSIGHSNETDARIDMQRSDEIGQLADEFDDMLEKLELSRQEIVRTARLAGMSEVSAGVLHNVGNALNSVSVSANLATAHIRGLASEDLSAIMSSLEGHKDDLVDYLTADSRGKHLLPFLTSLLEKREAQIRTVGTELQELEQGVQHVSSLISTLTNYDARIGVIERVDVAAQVDSAIEMSLRSLEGDSHVTITREYEQLGRVEVDRQKLMEILVNLVINALQAMDASTAQAHELTIRVSHQNNETLNIEVIDNGIGIAPSDLQRVFGQGFTTREGGRGLGLHLSATAAIELGGKLLACSDGAGQGATFSLCLPIASEAARSEQPNQFACKA